MKKRFRIEFTVDTDMPDEIVEQQALQELTCMSPYSEDITFERIGSVHEEIEK